MSNFMNLDTFSAKLGITRQTGKKYIENGDYPAFVRGKQYKIPSCVFDLKYIKEYEESNPESTNKPRVMMIGNQKGGSGKTTSSINVAASLAFFGKRVLLVDLDTQANASTINKLHTQYDFDENNVTKILLEMKGYTKGELEEVLDKTIVSVRSEHFTTGKLDLLPNSLEYDIQKEMLFTYANAENMLDRVFKPIKDNYDYITIDTHPSMDILWRMSVMASDAIIIGLMAEQYSIEGLGGVFKRIYTLNEDYIERKGHDIEILGALISNYKANTNIAQINAPIIQSSLERFCQYNESILLEPFISHSIKAWEQQTLRGPIMFDDPTSDMCAEYLAVTTSIMLQFHNLEKQRG